MPYANPSKDVKLDSIFLLGLLLHSSYRLEPAANPKKLDVKLS